VVPLSVPSIHLAVPRKEGKAGGGRVKQEDKRERGKKWREGGKAGEREGGKAAGREGGKEGMRVRTTCPAGTRD